jgi:alpha-1,2-glucosyltransferase
LLEILRNFSNEFVDKVVTAIKNNFYVIILDILFIAFLVWNKFSVVLGDKTSHSMVPHLAQINHLLIFFLVFFPLLNLKAMRVLNKDFWRLDNVKNFVIILSFTSTAIYISNQYSYTHNFLLADNRHYSFYYFHKIYLNEPLRALLLAYVSVIYSLLINDNRQLLNSPEVQSWLVCACLALIPAKLFEFRYLTLPMLIFVLIVHKDYPKWEDLHKHLINKFNIAWMILINAITIYVFLFRPFSNSFMDNTLSRFMW